MSTWPQYLSELAYSEWCKAHSGHEEYVCPGSHDDGGWACMFCAGGLFACVRCNSFEGATTSECPGVYLTLDQSDRVYAGIIDFRHGQWVAACTVVMMYQQTPVPKVKQGYAVDWSSVEQWLFENPYEPLVVDV